MARAGCYIPVPQHVFPLEVQTRGVVAPTVLDPWSDRPIVYSGRGDHGSTRIWDHPHPPLPGTQQKNRPDRSLSM